MKMLICSDGSPQADNAIRFASLIAAPCGATVTVLGIVEHPSEEAALDDALRRSTQALHEKKIETEIVTKHGHPIDEIQKRTVETNYDLVVIGAVRKGWSGPFCMSSKAYDIIRIIRPPVLVVIGKPTQLESILICSGGKSYIDKAVALTGEIVCKSGVTVTILHVLPEPPAIYTDLIAAEENVEKLLESDSVLGRNLRSEIAALEKLGVTAKIRLRHGLVTLEIQREIQTGDYDLVVVGSALLGGPIHTYMMGDVTAEMINRADCPVLVVRGSAVRKSPFSGFFKKIGGLFRGRKSRATGG
jgi:nucleotide-binding universal stress UspA family protein